MTNHRHVLYSIGFFQIISKKNPHEIAHIFLLTRQHHTTTTSSSLTYRPLQMCGNTTFYSDTI